jgi:hypothetical protein
MRRVIRWRRAFTSLLVVVGVLTSMWATCAEGATTPTQQMACCKAGHHDCPMQDSASDCCKQSRPQVESQGTIVKAATFSAPSPTPVTLAWVVLPSAVSAAHTQRRVSYDSSPPGLRVAPPAYIAFSALLI